MNDDIQLNVPFLRRRVPNLTTVAKAVGLRPATVSNLCTGKIPLARAEVRTLVTLATLAGCTLDELVIRGGGIGMMESGIKAVDLFSPLVRGGTIGFVASQNMGQLVLVQELFHRFGQRDYVTVFWSPFKPEEITEDDKYKGIQRVSEVAHWTATTLEEVRQIITTHRDEKDILLAADRRVVLSGELWTLRDHIQEAGARPVTTLLVDTDGAAIDEEAPYGPLDTLLHFDMNLVTRMLYPAVDPITSTSVLLEGTQLELTHITIQQRARKLLRRYRELRSLVSAWGIDRLSATDKVTYHRGERMEAFLSQPFFVAEPWTNKPGSIVSLEETLTGARRILDGLADDTPLEKLTYIGRLDSVGYGG